MQGNSRITSYLRCSAHAYIGKSHTSYLRCSAHAYIGTALACAIHITGPEPTILDWYGHAV